MSERKWIFPDPPDTMAITLKRILDNKSTIKYISHDAEDGMWQFLDGNEVEIDDSAIVSLQKILEYDPFIAKISDLALGWIAVRDDSSDQWVRSKKNVIEPIQQGYHCTSCGKYHDELPLNYGGDAPYYWYQIPPDEREGRCEINSYLCVIDGEDFFIKGSIGIPLNDKADTFSWDVWVSLSKENFEKTIELWDEEGRESKLNPMFGWLSTSLPCYPETLSLKTMVHTRRVGVRPFIELEPTEHPLAIEQRNGISMKRVQEIAESILYTNE